MQMLQTIREILATPAILVGFIVLVGLVLQKKPVDHVIKGTVTALVGFVMLSVGSEFLQNGALKDFGELFQYDFHIRGVIPNMEVVSAFGIQEYATTVSEMMILGMAVNLLLAKFGPRPYIFLTGHHTLYMASLLTVVLYAGEMSGWQILITGSLLLGALMTYLPAMMQKEMVRVTGNDRIALGHFSIVGYLIAAKVGALMGENKTEQQQTEQQEAAETKKKSAEDVKFPAKLSFMRDSTVGIFLVMTVIFLLLTGLAVHGTDLAELDISYKSGGYQNWIIYAVIQGAKFSVGIYIILAGVRLIIAEIVPAFKGIAAKIVPDAKPAVDCPVLFSYAPNAAMIGFLMSFFGGIVTMACLIGMNAVRGDLLLPVIVPGVAAHFFCGGSAGVFANARGGLKGCLIGAFVHGIILSLLALAVMPVIGNLNLSGTSFSDSDFCIVGIIIGNLGTLCSGYMMLALSVLGVAAPVIWEKIKK